MRPAAPRALLLDLDNTAYAYAPCHQAGLRRGQGVAAKIDPRWADPERFRADYRAARSAVKARTENQAASHSRLLYCKEMVERRRGCSHLEAILAIRRAYWDGYFAAMACDEGCAETLAEIRERGVRTAWVTSFTTERQIQKLAALGLETAVDLLVTTEEAGVEKPSGRLVDLALEKLGARRSETWVVGDNPSQDLGMAAARSLPFVWRRREDDPPGPDPLAPGPIHIVASWPELREVLRRAWGR